MGKNKKPRFFCDNCGYEVSNKTKACPHCGRFFSSVRCPSCGFSGQDRLFLKGCPACGYSVPTVTQPKKHHREAMSGWAFIISILVVLAIIAVLSYFLTR